MPVIQDPDAIYSKRSRWKPHAEPVTAKFMKERFFGYHFFINATINAYGTTWASEGPGKQAFTGEEKRKLLTEKPFILETSLSTDIVDSTHDLHYVKRRRAIWREVDYDDESLQAMFPDLMRKDIMAFNAGPYLHNKAHGYMRQLISHYQEKLNLF